MPVPRNVILLGFDPSPDVDALSEEVRRIAPDRDVVIAREWESISPWMDAIEIAAGWLPRERLCIGPALRWMQQWNAGSDWLLRAPQEAREAPFVLTNASGVHAEPIAEHVLGYLLNIVRRFPGALRAQDRGEWWRPGHTEGVDELLGKTMVLVGVGAIGSRVAELAAAFGMRVIGIRRGPGTPAKGVGEMNGPADLLRVLPLADFVVLTVPLTQETRGLVGEDALRAMKKTAWIVNIGRGEVIQEQVLVRALEGGRIAGAALDCFSQEPLPASSPLWRMENVLITAHYSGHTPRYEERCRALFLGNLQRYVTGQPLRNVVDKRLGY